MQAGNILIDSNGAVKLADFGVSACMFDTGDRQRSRNTFVGTPCWYFYDNILKPYIFCANIKNPIVTVNSLKAIEVLYLFKYSFFSQDGS